MSYNVHGCRGTDGRIDVERIAAVIVEQDPDLVTLQELDVDDPRSNRTNQPALLGELTNRAVHFRAARSSEGASFGNATLCRQPFDVVSEGGLPAHRDEARAAHCLRVSFGGVCVDLVNTHLSVRLRERLEQVKAIFLEGDPLEQTKGLFSPLVAPYDRLILCGDFNAGGWSPVTRWLRHKLRDVQGLTPGRARPTWPSTFPLLRLDHIWVGPELEVLRSFVPGTKLSKIASDHRPLVADLSLPASTCSPQPPEETHSP